MTAAPNLQKGGEVTLASSGLTKVAVGVGWDVPAEKDGFPVDIDLSAFLLKPEGRVRNDLDFVFYNNLALENDSVKHQGDSVDGEGDGDDEVIEINLPAVDFQVDRIVFTVTIHNAEERQQSFGIVKNAYIRIVNVETGAELAHFDLTEDASEYNGILFGELLRDMDTWKFRAIGHGTAGGLYKIAREYGVNVAPP